MIRHMNLLPKHKQDELAHEKLFYSLSVACVIASILMVVGVVVQFGVHTYLGQEIDTVQAEIDTMKRTANKTENAAVKQKIKVANAQIENFASLTSKAPQWSQVFAAFLNNVPPDIKITNLKANAEKKEITINGYAPTRDLVIELYNNINADKDHFKDINYPLENVSRPTNVLFTFTFTVVESLLITENK